jgi:hypothetical protein
MTDIDQPAIRFIDYMGDMDDYNATLIIGPYPDTTTRNTDLNRLRNLPLGEPEYRGGCQFKSATMTDARNDLGDRTVPPQQAAPATTIVGFYDAFYGRPPERELVEVPGQTSIYDAIEE